MSKLIKIDTDCADWIKDLSQRFRQSQIKAAMKVNSEMLKFYFTLGADIVNKQAESKWGDGFFSNLSQDLQEALPGVKGFSVKNLYYMKKMYLLYFQNVVIFPQLVGKMDVANSNLPQPVGKLSLTNAETQNSPQLVDDDGIGIFSLPWSHHRYIIDKVNGNREKALFYVQQTVKNNWSRSVLLNFLDTDLYERQGKAVTNFETTLPAVDGDLARQLVKDPYCFDFAGLTERYNEKELKDALIGNVEKFLIELGSGFAYMGREYRIQVGETELFADMLFYNTHLHCYVVVEVKTERFENAFLGQLSGYVSCANHVLKREGDNPTVGILICKSKDDVLVRYALEGYSQPLGISEYEWAKLYPTDFKGTLPSIEDIERELK